AGASCSRPHGVSCRSCRASPRSPTSWRRTRSSSRSCRSWAAATVRSTSRSTVTRATTRSVLIRGPSAPTSRLRTMAEFVTLDVSDGIGTMRLDRPPMNALNRQLQEEIRTAAREATVRSDVKSVIVYGGEKVFAAGADIKEMADLSYVQMSEIVGDLQSALGSIADIPKPTVAAI